MRDLTAKQRLFVEAYLANPNATDAARKAGYKGNDKTLSVVGAENLAKPYIARLLKTRIQKAIMTADEVLLELGDIAKAPWHKFFEYTMDNGLILKVDMRPADKIKALELVGKYHKLFTDKQQVEHTLDAATISRLAAERLIEKGWNEKEAWTFISQTYTEVSEAVN